MQVFRHPELPEDLIVDREPVEGDVETQVRKHANEHS